MRQPLPDMPYFVFVSRAEKRPITNIWPIALSDPLPVVPIPLLPGDDDVALDLQAIFTSVYDLLGLDLAVNYNQPPEVPLEPAAAEWVAERLRQAGFNSPRSPSPAS